MFNIVALMNIKPRTQILNTNIYYYKLLYSKFGYLYVCVKRFLCFLNICILFLYEIHLSLYFQNFAPIKDTNFVFCCL